MPDPTLFDPPTIEPEILTGSIPRPDPPTPYCPACGARAGAPCTGSCESRTIGRGGNRSSDLAPPAPAS